MRNIELIADGVIAAVKSFVAQESGILAKAFGERMDVWEKRIAAIPAGPRGEKGDPGESIKGDKGDPGDVGQKGDQGERGADGARGGDGKDGGPGVAGDAGQAGKSAYQLAVERGFTGTELQWLDSLSGKPGRDGINGKDAAPVDTAAVAREAAALVPAPKDGRDGAPGATGETGPAGKNADPAMIAAMVADGVAKALPGAVQRAIDDLMPDIIARAAEAVPRPRDGADGANGKDATVDTGAIVREVVALIPAPRDGIDGMDAPAIDLDAVVAKAVALIPVPKDGAAGSSVTLDDVRPILEAETARHQLEFERRATDVLQGTIQRAIDGMPKPENGKDGHDAAQLDTLVMALDERMLKFSLSAGDRVISQEVRVPIPIYRGVFRSGSKYEENDMVTHSGALWMAMRDTATHPPSDDWRLCVARGRAGKDAAP